MSSGKLGWLSTALVLAALGPRPAPAADPSPTPVSPSSPGSRVVLKTRDVRLEADQRAVAPGDAHRVFRVERAERDRLLIAAGDVRGWVRGDQVLPLDQASAYFTALIARAPSSAWAYKMRALVEFDRNELDRALDDWNQAIRLDPKDVSSYTNRALAWSAKHEYDRAIADDNQAARLNPNDPSAYHNRGNAWLAKREYDLAVADYNEAIRLDPKDPAKYRSRALAWSALGEYEPALADYDAAIRVQRDDAMAYNGRGWILATCPDPRIRDGKGAVEAATRACELTGRNDPYCLGTLAAAEAERGRFDEAVAWQLKALDRFPQSDGDSAGHRKRLALYRDRKPYRTPARDR